MAAVIAHGVRAVTGSFFWFWNPGGKFYVLISGVVADLGLLGGLLLVFRKLNCHVKGCWRLGHHDVQGTPYKVCRKHHPDVPDDGATADHVAQAHRLATGKPAARAIPPVNRGG